MIISGANGNGRGKAGRNCMPLVDDASEKGRITKLYADSAYDYRANFNLLYLLNAETATKPRG